MADENDILPTPANYATPNQLQWNRELAKALLIGNQAKGNGAQFQPVGHWSQGISNVINALVGGYTANKAWRDERLSNMADAHNLANVPAPAGSSGPVGFTSDADGGSPAQPPVRSASFASPRGGMGRGYTPGIEPDDSDLYDPKGKPPDNMSLGSDPPATFSDRWGPFGSGKAPTANVSALPFDADASANANSGMPMDAQSAITMALSKGAAPQSPFGRATGAPPVGGTQAGAAPLIDPRTLPKRPSISRQQFEAVMGSSMASPAMKEMTAKQYYEQYQPMEIPYPGGSVVVDPISGAQQFKPGLENTPFKANGAETQVKTMVVPDGKGGYKQIFIPAEGIGGQQGEAAPSQGSAPPPINVAPRSSPVIPSSPATPGVVPPSPTASPSSAAPGVATPMKFAPDEGGIDKSGLPPEITGSGMLGSPPPMQDKVRTAQVPPQFNDFANWAQKRQLNYEHQNELNKKDADALVKSADDWSSRGTTAASSVPQLELAKSMVQDPRMYSGPLSNWAQLYKQAQATFGKDPTAAAPMEVFQKLISGEIIKDLRTELQGTGQVRLAEIDLLSKAAASLDRTKPSNEAVLELMIRSRNLTAQLGQISAAYRQGFTYDKDGKPVKIDGVPSKGGLDTELNKWIKDHPIVSEKERSYYDGLFSKYDRKKYDQVKGQLSGSAPAPKTVPPLPGPQ